MEQGKLEIRTETEEKKDNVEKKINIHMLGYGACAAIILGCVIVNTMNSSEWKKTEDEYIANQQAYEIEIAEKSSQIDALEQEIARLEKEVEQAEKVSSLYEQLLEELKK